MPTERRVIRPHNAICGHCRPAGTDHSTGILYEEGVGHDECQESDCGEAATFTWPRASGDATESVMACEAHALHVDMRDKTHRDDCPAPDPGCACEW